MKKRTLWKKIFVGVITGVFTISLLTGCGSSNQTADSGKNTQEAGSNEAADTKNDFTFRYIVNNVGDVTTFDIALEKGFFKEEGVNVENVGVAGGGSAVIETIESGGADLGNAALPAYINSVASGINIKVIYGGPAIAHEGDEGYEDDPGYQLLVAKDSDISSAKDLVGKTVAVAARGAMFEYTVRLYLENAGLSIDDVNLLVVPSAQHEEVIESGQADACVDGSPIADKMIENGTAKNLTDVYHVLGEDLAGNGWGDIVSEEVIEEHPEEVKKLVSALVKADEWTEANPDEAREVVKKILVDREQNEELAQYWHPIKVVNHGLWTEESVQFWIDYGVKVGNTEKDAVTTDQIYTNEFNPYFEQ